MVFVNGKRIGRCFYSESNLALTKTLNGVVTVDFMKSGHLMVEY
jgi:hypothetical protein